MLNSYNTCSSISSKLNVIKPTWFKDVKPIKFIIRVCKIASKAPTRNDETPTK